MVMRYHTNKSKNNINIMKNILKSTIIDYIIYNLSALIKKYNCQSKDYLDTNHYLHTPGTSTVLTVQTNHITKAIPHSSSIKLTNTCN